jgi:predicted RNA binding protein with dsRBD fold (UPF0201 family)
MAKQEVGEKAGTGNQAQNPESSESSNPVLTEGEVRMRELEAKHAANLEALNAAAEAEALSREAQLAQTLQPLEASLQKAEEDIDPDACEKIQAEIDEATAAVASATAIAAATHKASVANATSFHQTCAAKLEELLAAQGALAAVESNLSNKPRAAEVMFAAAKQARAAALEAAAEEKLGETKQAISMKDYAKAKTLKAEFEELKARATTAAAGEDDAGKEERQQMEDEAKALQHSVADATAEVKRCEEELALLPETADAFACAAVGCPMRSTCCWTANNDVIGKGEVGTVVGFLHGQGKVEVKFSKVTWPLAPDQLITPEAWKQREEVRSNVSPSPFLC